MQIENMKSYVAGSYIGRSRVVRISDDFKVIECDGTNLSVRPVGIAQANGNKAPGTPFEVSYGLAASANDSIMVYTDGADDAWAQCCGTISAGDSLGVNALGLVISNPSYAASFHWLVGYAKEDGAAGDVIRVRVHIVPTPAS
jgi:hypothetical protein